MATITTRAGKNASLTNAEMDSNFSNLNTAKYEAGNTPSFTGAAFNTNTGASKVRITRVGTNDQALEVYVDDVNVEFKSIQDEGNHNRWGGYVFRSQNAAAGGTTKTLLNMDQTIVCFNGDGADMDFRYESETNPHALFFDASENVFYVNKDGVQDEDPSFDVRGVSNLNGLRAVRGITDETWIPNTKYYVCSIKVPASDNAVAYIDFTFNGLYGLGTAEYVVKSVGATQSSLTTANASCDMVGGNNLYDLTLHGVRHTTAAGVVHIYASHRTSTSITDVTVGIRGSGDVYVDPNAAATYTGNAQYVWTDLHPNFHDINVRKLHYKSPLTINERVTFTSTETVFNEGGGDVDFRVESDNNTHALFLEAATGYLHFGRSAAANTTRNRGAYLQTGSGRFYVTADAYQPLALFRSDFSNNAFTGQEPGRVILFGHRNNISVGNVSFNTSGTAVQYNTTSDRRLKQDIEPIEGAWNKIIEMNPVTFRFKSNPDGDPVMGFIAQSMKEIVPEAVSGSEDDVDEDGNPAMMGMDYGRITPVIVSALQEALAEIQELKARVAELEGRQ